MLNPVTSWFVATGYNWDAIMGFGLMTVGVVGYGIDRLLTRGRR